MGGPLEDALHPTFRRSAPSSFPCDAHQNAITIPGVVELVVSDVDVIATVIPDGETKALAAATQPSIDELLAALTHHTVVTRAAHHTELPQRDQGQIETALVRLVGQLEDLGQRWLGNRLVVRKLIQQISNRELHGGGGRIRPSRPGGDSERPTDEPGRAESSDQGQFMSSQDCRRRWLPSCSAAEVVRR